MYPGGPVGSFSVSEKIVGAGRCFVIAEVAQAHDGSLGTAHAFIDAAADAGADAVKFQTHLAEAESTTAEPWRVRFSLQDTSRFDYWKRMEFTPQQWTGLAAHCRDRGVVFLSTPFSLEAVELLEALRVPAWKVGSGEVTNLPLLERLAVSGKPIILSSGMSSWADLDRAVRVATGTGSSLAVLQCASRYPTPAEHVGLNVLAQIAERYRCPVGISDHSGTIWPAVAAASLGADLVEIHITFSKKAFGPDNIASVTIEELEMLVRGIRFISAANANPVEKDTAATELAPLRVAFGRSIVASRDLPLGTVVSAADLALKKPAGGLPPERFAELLGRRTRRELLRNETIAEDDFD